MGQLRYRLAKKPVKFHRSGSPAGHPCPRLASGGMGQRQFSALKACRASS